MFPDFCSFHCFGSRSSDDTDSDRNPVLLVSGIGGSIFHSKGKKYGCETRVWVQLLLAEFEFKKKIWSVYNPKTGYTEALDKDSEIEVPDDDYGLYAIDILDPSWFVKTLHIPAAYHFHDMIDMLLKCGYKKGTRLFGYGYDFRQSNRIDKLMEGLKAKLETAYSASGCRKVNIISHSMGGLLVSCFMSLHREVFTKFVNKWICIACPFQGAPGCINDSLLTGMQFVEGFENNFFISRRTMHQLILSGKSNRKFKSGESKRMMEKLVLYCSPMIHLKVFFFFEDALRNNELSYNGNTIALPFNFSILKWAFGTRHVLNNAQLPEGVSFYNIFGTSYDTPFDVRYGTKTSPIEDLSEVCHSTPEYSYVDGDGTVPAESAKSDSFAAAERIGVTACHRGLLCDKTVFQLIQNWLGVKQSVSKHLRMSKVVDSSSDSDDRRLVSA